MLLGEDFRGRHQGHLITRFKRLQGRHRRDHGLAGTHVALDQAQHGFGLAEVVGNLVADPGLCASRGEAQVGEELLRQFFRLGQRRGLLRAQALAQALLRQLVRQQLFKGQPVLGPVMAQGEFFNVGIGGGLMQVANGLIQRGQLIVLGQLRRQPVGQAARAKHGQALLAELA